jgi:thiol:disulfide interchange protein
MVAIAKSPANQFSQIRWIAIGVLVCAVIAAGLRFKARGQTPITPFVPKHLYSDKANPKADIAAALAKAKHEHKRVLLDFGGDWCGDCQVLDIYFHQPPNAQLLEKNFVLVHVWIGQMDKNLDIAAKYGVPIKRGVPALAVLSPDGKVIYSQGTGQFSNMSHMESKSVTQFLKKWKA